MAVLPPGAADLDAYWRNLGAGVDAITDVPAGRWDAGFYDPQAVGRSDRVYCRRGGFVDELAEVEVTRFGIMPTRWRAPNRTSSSRWRWSRTRSPTRAARTGCPTATGSGGSWGEAAAFGGVDFSDGAAG